MSIKERLIYFIKYKKIPIKRFEEMCSLSNGYVSSMRKSLGTEKLEIVLNAFPELNRDWLLYGEGEMLQIEKKEVTLQPEGTQMEFDFNKWIELENKKTDVAAKNADSMQALVGNNTTLTQTNETLVSMLKEALRDGKDVDKKIDAITAQMEGFLRPSGTKPAKDVR